MTVDALEYHRRTKHSPKSVREGQPGLDFDIKPRPYKVYADLPSVPLADSIRPPQQPALSAVAEPTPDGVVPADGEESRVDRLDRETVATLCYYAAGITKRIELRNRSKLFRAASTTGALYHVDLYAVCGDRPRLEAGVYHFDPRTFSLDVLRAGDFRGVLAAASGDDAVGDAPLSIVATSTWWRNAWKYEERTFRHAFWDSGTTLANLLAVAHALDLRAEVVAGFADRPVADLLGVDPEREAPLEIVPIGVGDGGDGGDGGAGDTASDAAAVDPIDPDTEPLSPTEREYPLLYEAWDAGALEDGAAAALWRSDGPSAADSIGTRDAGDRARVPLEPVGPETASSRPLHETIRRRGSCRQYDPDPISFRKLSTVLDRAVRGVAMDCRRADDRRGASNERADAPRRPSRNGARPLSFCDPYLVANGVEGLESGSYHYHPEAGELERLRSGDYRQEATHLALDQRLGGDAAACLYFLTDLEAVVDALGDRGYRVAQLEAALTAGRLYLATYAHRALGGTGLTFYDDLVTEFFAPRAAGQTPLFLYTIGRPA
ncbi:SagB/ThcOx family dehydrogenase [Natronolimnohabitans innermongolicus]|uniref:SagB-type dehydrogenase domain-containing protein n=1 Tax=Natronolimnohabitans innermongolicus JCM 12255 TaxID=1227499 RepID=L9WZ60_9EURY|nr:SagB/ThcOx family dehydrogenase [Natronolimnohabitans innermongolicus]ELY54774.1 SagB-type dehydrogenase domain-containing protein [Natronolimnohabitans innermongolicus JCM 12255]